MPGLREPFRPRAMADLPTGNRADLSPPQRNHSCRVLLLCSGGERSRCSGGQARYKVFAVRRVAGARSVLRGPSPRAGGRIGASLKLAATIASNSARSQAGSAQTSSANSRAVASRRLMVSGIVDHPPATSSRHPGQLSPLPISIARSADCVKPRSEIILSRPGRNGPGRATGGSCAAGTNAAAARSVRRSPLSCDAIARCGPGTRFRPPPRYCAFA